MSPLVTGNDLAQSLARLSPYLRESVERAALTADRLHADEVALEHLLLVLLEDEECGAHQLILHAFADPDTLRSEVLALAPGILVVGSGMSLPFSSAGVRALFAARRRSAGAVVDPPGLFASSLAELSEEIVESLREAGLELAPLEVLPASGDEPGGVFRTFDTNALRALGAACRAAQGFRRTSISPAHLLLGCLELAPGRELSGLRLGVARMRLGGRDEDTSPAPERDLAVDAALHRFLSELPSGAGTSSALHAACQRSSEELRLLLSQQRITEELTGAVGASFGDPDGRPS